MTFWKILITFSITRIYKAPFHILPWPKCFCMFTMSTLTLISTLKERIYTCLCLPQFSLFNRNRVVAMLCRRKGQKNCSFWTHSVLRKVCCGVTGEIFIYILSRLTGGGRREGKERHNNQRAGSLLAACVCRPPSFPMVTGCPAGPPATHRRHGDSHTCVSHEGDRRSIYITRAPWYGAWDVWDGRRENGGNVNWLSRGEMRKDMHART